jgi:hypothetical protein
MEDAGVAKLQEATVESEIADDALYSFKRSLEAICRRGREYGLEYPVESIASDDDGGD